MSGRGGREVQKWADTAMFASEKHDASSGPRVHLLAAPMDPLGQIAACAKMYKGEVVRSLSEVTHAERVEYMEEMKKTKLKMPLEAVTFHFMFENVTRAFTHQLVRQRTAAYAQESMRFAVVEDMSEAVALPPSLAGTQSFHDAVRAAQEDGMGWVEAQQHCRHQGSERDKARWLWDETVAHISDGYSELIARGIPAEDARGLMPTNIVTRINYITNLRGLLDHAGNRLCTQAQFEWRAVFAQIAGALRGYRPHGAMLASVAPGGVTEAFRDEILHVDASGATWQYEAIADLLQPVCYQIGKCAFEANFDRHCSIRARVQASAEVGRPSSSWESDWQTEAPFLHVEAYNDSADPTKVGRLKSSNAPVFIGGISPREWLTDPGAARVKGV